MRLCILPILTIRYCDGKRIRIRIRILARHDYDYDYDYDRPYILSTPTPIPIPIPRVFTKWNINISSTTEIFTPDPYYNSYIFCMLKPLPLLRLLL